MFGNDSILGNLLTAGVIGLGGMVATYIAGRAYRAIFKSRRVQPNEGGSILGTRTGRTSGSYSRQSDSW